MRPGQQMWERGLDPLPMAITLTVAHGVIAPIVSVNITDTEE
jgi:hypothetical protein